jgi:hydrogenase expression/formation protein HypE
MAVREGLEFESNIESDCAPLSDAVQALLAAGIEIHCLRDLTRGGLASALNEIAVSAGVEIEIDESLIPVREDVQAVCEILGFDPLYVANEGRFIAFVPEADVESALEVLNLYQSGASGLSGAIAHTIGSVTQGSTGLVKLKSKIGVQRIVHLLSGEQLPRIC